MNLYLHTCVPTAIFSRLYLYTCILMVVHLVQGEGQHRLDERVAAGQRQGWGGRDVAGGGLQPPRTGVSREFTSGASKLDRTTISPRWQGFGAEAYAIYQAMRIFDVRTTWTPDTLSSWTRRQRSSRIGQSGPRTGFCDRGLPSR